ncbi:hypothetical protein [Hamadaea tsunoensis]|uniref:hypothetical protein n=1 Tax=Hamadaea tsunoensis TaxID=53368 RepID=UPI0004057B28|nr:hypothetical protein [Hamadaea tsunoensis]
MPGWLKGLLTVVLFSVAPPAFVAGLLSAAGKLDDFTWLVVATAIAGFLYGLEAGIMLIYDLGDPVGWVALVVDMTWSLPNTIWGLFWGNVIFWFIGTPSRTASEGQTWISFSGRLGKGTLQTHGTINLGGAGQHEKLHLMQARVFGPLFLPLYLAFYAITAVLQVLWCALPGWIAVVAGWRQKVPLQPPAASVVGGFFGWIYYATLFELWAYNAGNP